ncbi:MAG: phosphoesterase [Nitrospirae bacterium]|nr:phosphoesterase [Nitrospirota bacterium]MBF0533750.1 phosphoesterase [Nitrospirota bacterium]MBF0615541.1 phosphoesterase [Nitrospirota bacterium]
MPVLLRRAMTVIAVVIMMGLCCVVTADAGDKKDALHKINHIVVLYQENHSFDNLYGLWEGVNGLNKAHIPQIGQNGIVLGCLPQVDVNLLSPEPLPVTCSYHGYGHNIDSHFTNALFPIDDFISPKDNTCPKPDDKSENGIAKGNGESGGCTMDLDHRFYQEIYQIDGGKMDRYVVGSNAAGLTMGYYNTKRLPIYVYLHAKGHPNYVIADNFFQAAFGGSFLNHQWLIAAKTPLWLEAVNDGSKADLHAVVDLNGMPKNTPLYASPTKEALKDNPLTASCYPGEGRNSTPPTVVCGDYAVNTIQPGAWPYNPKADKDSMRLPPLTYPTIGDRLNDAGVDWAWYSGGWASAEGDNTQPGYTAGNGPSCPESAIKGSSWPKCPDRLFQFHHQPFNYFAAYAPGTEARKKHLRDEVEFIQLAKSSKHKHCNLKPVSFVKPLGNENEHPGYSSEWNSNAHLIDLIKAVENSVCARDTMVIVAYDEFGGQADHVTPPDAANSKGPYDQWGPGTRIPVLIIAPNLRNKFAIDHQEHDTTSIMATIAHRFNLVPLGSRDEKVEDLSTVFNAKKSYEQQKK